jgi:hypothetical protein
MHWMAVRFDLRLAGICCGRLRSYRLDEISTDLPVAIVHQSGHLAVLNSKALERLALIKQIKLEKAHFSLICHDLSHLTEYSKQLSNPVFKLMRNCIAKGRCLRRY